MKKIVICGGHLTCAQATIEELEKNKEVEIIFFGRKYSTEGSNRESAEYKVITEKKIEFRQITTGRLQRKFTRYTIPSLLKIPMGILQSFINLLVLRPKVVVSFGGYLSTPIVFSAWLLGVPSITHEQASIPGLANKINSLFVEKIFITWPQSKDFFPEEKTILIGNPTRQAIFKEKFSSSVFNKFVKNSNQKLIFVTGGNQGSHFLNNLIFSSTKKLFGYKIMHQLGTVDHLGDHQKAKNIRNPNYMPVDYINSQDIGATFANTDLVISRSGANTVWELASLAKVAILVPLPDSASNEQTENAKILEEAGSVKIINQKNLTPDVLVKEIKDIFKNYQNFKKSAITLQTKIPNDASQKLAAAILKYT